MSRKNIDQRKVINKYVKKQRNRDEFMESVINIYKVISIILIILSIIIILVDLL